MEIELKKRNELSLIILHPELFDYRLSGLLFKKHYESTGLPALVRTILETA